MLLLVYHSKQCRRGRKQHFRVIKRDNKFGYDFEDDYYADYHNNTTLRREVNWYEVSMQDADASCCSLYLEKDWRIHSKRKGRQC